VFPEKGHGKGARNEAGDTFCDPSGVYLFTVAAGILPAVEPGILPGGYSCGFRRQFLAQRCHSGRQDAALYGSQDGRRYTRAHHGDLPVALLRSAAGKPQSSLRDS